MVEIAASAFVLLTMTGNIAAVGTAKRPLHYGRGRLLKLRMIRNLHMLKNSAKKVRFLLNI